jgi:hypothetical protein
VEQGEAVGPGFQPAAGDVERLAVTVQADDAEVGMAALQEGAGVAAEAQGGIHEQAGGFRTEVSNDLLEKHRGVARCRGGDHALLLFRSSGLCLTLDA